MLSWFWIKAALKSIREWLIRFEQWSDFLSIIVWKILFPIFFIHANCFVHKIVSIFSRFEDPYTNSVLWMIDCFQFIIYITDFFWDFCLNTNHDSNLLNGNRMELTGPFFIVFNFFFYNFYLDIHILKTLEI